MSLLSPEKWKKITPFWFDWIEWFLALGAIGFLAEKTKVVGLLIIYGISYVVFLMFINSTISDITDFMLINNSKFIKNHKFNQIITLLLSIGLIAVTYVIINQSIRALIKG